MPPRIIISLIQGVLSGEAFTFEERATCLVGKEEVCALRFPRDKDHLAISRHPA